MSFVARFEINGFTLLYNSDIHSNVGLQVNDPAIIEAAKNKDCRLLDAIVELFEMGDDLESVSFAEDSLDGWSRSKYHDGTRESWQRLINNRFTDDALREKIFRYLRGENQEIIPHRYRKVKDPAGHVYLIRAETGHYKIGRSKNAFNRARTFGIRLPFETELIHQIDVPDMIAAEARLHAMFADKRANGEWFELSEEDVEFIKSLDPEAV